LGSNPAVATSLDILADWLARIDGASFMAWQSDQGDAAALYEQGIKLSHEQGRGGEAERVFAAAVAAYRRLEQSGDDLEASKAGRGLARALWRYSMQLMVGGRRMEAMAPGREGVAIFREMLDAAPDDEAIDELVGELAT